MSLRMNGLHKSAVLLMSLGAEHAEDILRRLPDDVTEQLNGEIIATRKVPPGVRVEVLAEFCDAAEGVRMLPPPEPQAADGSRAPGRSHSTPFAALHDANPDNLVDCLRGEHPQAIALILAHLPAGRCAEVLSSLSGQQQFEVVKRLAQIEQASPDVIREVEHSLEGRVESIVHRVTRSGNENAGAVAEVLDRAARGGGYEPSPSPTPRRDWMFTFEDLLRLNDAGVRCVLEGISNEKIALSLRTATRVLRQKILLNVPQDAALAVQECERMLDGAPIADVEAAQREIADALCRMATVGEIEVASRRDESGLVA
jgi:flagellar motor switch protein FliG